MNTSQIVSQLQKLNLTKDEAVLYVELLQGPSSHLQLSQTTGINRTKVYRLIEQLTAKSLVARRTDDRGTFLVASDPATLEVTLVTQEATLIKQRNTLNTILPVLQAAQGQDSRAFLVRTYEGTAGLKQMCWHELKTKGDTVAFGNGTIEQISSDPRWSKVHRQRQIAMGYRARDLINYETNEGRLPDLTHQRLIDTGLYSFRVLPPEILTFDSQTVVYNDTVAIYHWKHEQKVGIEIISPSYAAMMREMFEYFWNLAGQQKS